MSFLNPYQSYTFSQIFALKIQSDDLAKEFGYTLTRQRLNLAHYTGDLDRLEELKARIEEILPYINLANETTRREMLIARVVADLIHYTKSEVRIEYPIKVSEQLQGYLDYLIEAQTNFLVIEAKQEDLTYGFTQLIAELIALDQWQNSSTQAEILGAVTTGTIWQFGRLHRASKHFDQGLDSYRVPDDLEPLMRILVQALVA